MDPIEVAVVGGSLGGLTTACLLRDAGHDVTVYERSPRELEQRGAGIGFLPESARYLVERAGAALDSMSIATDRIRYLDRSGAVVRDTGHFYRFSSWNALYRLLLNHWGPSRYLLGHELVDFADADDRVTVSFGNGRHTHADLLVCADGVGSISRARLQPNAAVAYAGYVALRGMVAEADLEPELVRRFGDAITYHVSDRSHILVYPIPGLDGSVAPGERLINFVWYRNYREGPDLDDLMTDSSGVRRGLSVPPGSVAEHQVAEIRTAAARLPGPITSLVEAAELFVQVIYDIEVDSMAFGRVCLLGDAAYVARPHAAAGTAKAADDGWKLAEALDRAGSVTEALRSWEPGRLALGSSLLERTRRIGHMSQVEGSWDPADPELLFGLHPVGTPPDASEELRLQ